MRNSAKIVISTFFLYLIVVITAFFSTEVFAVEYRVGEIENGRWTRYYYYYNYMVVNSTQSGEPPVINQTEQGFYEIKVKNVFDPVVTLSVTKYLDNDVTQEQELTGNVKTGEGDLSFFLIAGGLRKGDSITEKENAPKINQTGNVHYGNASREVNRAALQESYALGTYSYEVIFSDVFWDRKTGFMCEMMVEHNIIQDGDNYTITTLRTKMSMLETDLWNPEQNNGVNWLVPAAGLSVLVLLAIGIFLFKRAH